MADPDEVCAALESALEGRASGLLLNRLCECVRRTPEEGGDWDDCLRRIKVAVRTFVDEGLAETVDAQLRQVLGLGAA